MIAFAGILPGDKISDADDLGQGKRLAGEAGKSPLSHKDVDILGKGDERFVDGGENLAMDKRLPAAVQMLEPFKTDYAIAVCEYCEARASLGKVGGEDAQLVRHCHSSDLRSGRLRRRTSPARWHEPGDRRPCHRPETHRDAAAHG